MSLGTIQNRENFLRNIANTFGRKVNMEGVNKPVWKHSPQWNVFQDATQDELLDILIEQCSKIFTEIMITSSEKLHDTLKKAVENLGGGPIVTWKDSRFDAYSLTNLLKMEWPLENVPVHEWDTNAGQKNIMLAEKANVGITFSDLTLAESGTVVLFSDKNKGRSVSLLPATYIAIIPKSTIVPRISQAAREIHLMVEQGKNIPTCINFITGPSNSADIELNLVVGVHGPIKATYIVVDDR